MTENMKKFLEMISQDDELAQKCSTMCAKEIISLAQEMGITLTAADFENPTVEELSDDELDAVAGGQILNCSCALGGGGKGDSNDKPCACVALGLGYRKDGSERCFCPLAGIGYQY